ncbi:B3 domain-containing protein [Actinidia chinensis var. chinensis]|uniref:B3 domain-containing protein n=1 Tax=Actinidia chinensis var. chinensis TaxID=1590841 RepID=A0A2R6RC02_ACTCC|nr:B3 domain-containing protein [Actinidia chinensis var. chinensis]
MAISQSSLSKRSPINGRKPLEAKRKLFRKRPSALKTTTKKVISHNPKKPQSESKGTMISHDSIQTDPSVMKRSQEVQANLAAEFPSFVKLMLQSHVTRGFWLSFPKQFCDLHLPKHDDTVILVDESDEQYKVKYLVEKNGLSGGWRGFAIAHKLLERDVLVFQLVQHCKFKVYIVRANGLTEIDGAIALLTLDACVKPMDVDQTEKDMTIYGEGEKCSESLSVDFHQCNVEENGMFTLSTVAEQPGNDSDEFGSEVLEGIRFSESSVDFKDINSIENFTILVDGLVIDSEIPPHLQSKYYELCCSQNAFLHDHLLDGLNCKLAAGIICETVNIADAIRASKLTTSRDNFTTWDNTLKAFEKLGMNVKFLCARLDRLVSFAFDSERVLESKRVERVQAEEEIRTLEAKLLQVKELMKNLDEEIDGLKGKNKMLEVKFCEEANAPW